MRTLRARAASWRAIKLVPQSTASFNTIIDITSIIQQTRNVQSLSLKRGIAWFAVRFIATGSAYPLGRLTNTGRVVLRLAFRCPVVRPPDALTDWPNAPFNPSSPLPRGVLEQGGNSSSSSSSSFFASSLSTHGRQVALSPRAGGRDRSGAALRGRAAAVIHAHPPLPGAGFFFYYYCYCRGQRQGCDGAARAGNQRDGAVAACARAAPPAVEAARRVAGARVVLRALLPRGRQAAASRRQRRRRVQARGDVVRVGWRRVVCERAALHCAREHPGAGQGAAAQEPGRGAALPRLPHRLRAARGSWASCSLAVLSDPTVDSFQWG